MKRNIAVAVLMLIGIVCHAQYKNDNKLYKTISWYEVCSEIKKNPGCLVLDVRSKGEYEDTSSYKSLNIGRLKDAVNIPVQELDKRMHEINDYKDKTVFVYCSHSQRSRRSSKMLADSGFKYVYNINGGLTDFYMDNTLVHSKCLNQLVKQKNKYQLLSVNGFCTIMSEDKDALILDVRPDAAWQHKDTNARWNAYGNFKKAVHIPLADLYNNLSSIPKEQQVLLVDLDGDDVFEAAELLDQNGYKRIGILMDGITRWYASADRNAICSSDAFVRAAPYNIVSIKEFIGLMQNKVPYMLVDTRSAKEFANADETKWKNMGHIKTAKNIPAGEMKEHMSEIADYANKPILLYSGGNSADLFAAADTLSKNGFKNVYVLSRGIFDIRWMAANIKGMDYLAGWVIDVPE